MRVKDKDTFKKTFIRKSIEKYTSRDFTSDQLDLEKRISKEVERMKHYTTNPDIDYIRKREEKNLMPILKEIEQNKKKADSLLLRSDLNEILSHTLESIVDFDLGVQCHFENVHTDPNELSAPIGIQCINDFYYIGIIAYGDWENPLYFILYLNEIGDIGGYVPKEGNRKSDDNFSIEDFDWNLIAKDIQKNILRCS